MEKQQIIITKEQFDNAVKETMMDNILDPKFNDNADARMLYIMGGACFAREVSKKLFGGNEE